MSKRDHYLLYSEHVFSPQSPLFAPAFVGSSNVLTRNTCLPTACQSVKLHQTLKTRRPPIPYSLTPSPFLRNLFYDKLPESSPDDKPPSFPSPPHLRYQIVSYLNLAANPRKIPNEETISTPQIDQQPRSYARVSSVPFSLLRTARKRLLLVSPSPPQKEKNIVTIIIFESKTSSRNSSHPLHHRPLTSSARTHHKA